MLVDSYLPAFRLGLSWPVLASCVPRNSMECTLRIGGTISRHGCFPRIIGYSDDTMSYGFKSVHTIQSDCNNYLSHHLLKMSAALRKCCAA